MFDTFYEFKPIWCALVAGDNDIYQLGSSQVFGFGAGGFSGMLNLFRISANSSTGCSGCIKQKL